MYMRIMRTLDKDHKNALNGKQYNKSSLVV